MGYRSEVAIKCEEKAYEMLKETCHNMDIMPEFLKMEINIFSIGIGLNGMNIMKMFQQL